MIDLGVVDEPFLRAPAPGARGPRRRPDPGARWRGAAPLGAALALLWLPALAYALFAPPSYVSEASLLIPGTGAGSSLNLENVGQASVSAASPYASSSVDPKVNYKAIMTSSTVLADAARRAGLAPSRLGRPRVELVDQTAIVAVAFEADTAPAARLRVRSLHEAFEAELSRLRADERERVRSASAAQLDGYRRQMGEAQARLLEFQAAAGTVSAEQLADLLGAIERLRARRDELDLELASGRGRVEALSAATGLDPESSAGVVKLQQDRVLLELLEGHSGARAEYLDEVATLGANHPRIRVLRARMDAVQGALRDRSVDVLGFADAGFVERFLPAGGDGEPSVYRELVALGAEVAADASERDALDELIATLDASVQTSAENVARFEELERGYRVAETVFLSALAKLDLGGSDAFASYPLTQVLVAPTLPERPERLGRLFALLGAAAGTAPVLLGFLLHRRRDAWFRTTQRSA